MTTPSLAKHFSAWEALNTKQRQIRQDPDLTPAGRDKALAQLDKQRTQLRQRAYDDFAAAWADVRNRFAANERARGAALASERARTDYPALQYEVGRISAKIAHAHDPAELRTVYAAEKNDSLLARAWRDASEASTNSLAPAVLEELMHIRRQSADNVLRFLSPEQKAVEERGRQLASDALQLIEDTKIFGALGESVWSMDNNDFARLLDGVTVNREYMAGFGFKTTVVIVAPASDDLERLSVPDDMSLEAGGATIREGQRLF